LDGTRVLTHFSTSPEMPWNGSEPNLMNTATYNANLNAFTALGSWVKLKHKEAQNVALMSYGYGDGGGGPTREMNENARELRHFPALPKVKQTKVLEFFRRLEQESSALLPEWNAELYLEIHRGTYTTQSRNKRANRKSEFLLHDTEFLAVMAALQDASWQVPQQEIRKAWELICLNQFHDIIPGSSINAVYHESLQQYAEIHQLATSVRDAALDVIRQQTGGDVLLVNPTSFERDDLAVLPGELPAGKGIRRGNRALAWQPIEGGVLVDAGEMDPYSIVALQYSDSPAPAPSTGLICEDHLLENNWLRVELNADGDICRIFDKVCQREVLPPGTVSNQWQAFDDRPLNWDAWDIDIYYDDKRYLAAPADSVCLIERGPLRATIEIQRRILNSAYTQRISLVHNRRQLDIDTTIDWRERHVLLKAAFPVDVLSPVATHEVQWGFVQRPTHRNTSWDWARFETCAQKWVDLSEGDYGVALLNDSKYGHDIQGNVIRISLLRAPTLPDPEADQGIHHFQYSLLPHGQPDYCGVNYHAIAAQAYLLNDPLVTAAGSGAAVKPQPALLSVSGSAIIETVKQAEDGDGVIVRLYECNRQRGWVTLHSGFALQSAQITNLLEENQETLEVDGQNVRLYLKPFQIVNVRLQF
jgi:alpha-mannosidase